MNKKTSKKFKPAYTVDMTGCETAFDLLVRFGLAKQAANLPITDDELDAIIEEFGNTTIIVEQPVVCTCEQQSAEVGRKPWYKRMWNKLTGKKN